MAGDVDGAFGRCRTKAARWSWAELYDAQLDLVRQTEESLGADVVLVYTPGRLAT